MRHRRISERRDGNRISTYARFQDLTPKPLQGRLVLLYGFVKKTQKTPPAGLALARRREQEIET
ncbi:hypothetical protein [Benzoatithermus flavus]|uniref:Phage derived protein Gp49-like n=1 Tax=Benzoatithermus flavus TaxID=3108223 RepID=A0ABU8XRK7_9PROT